ncbi:Vacuolar protein sorting/targeting protein 10 [Thelohanellus kitauei]|uniref:Vacuolar protein sorting/targeting protein 10 n=1 Tax=Thelohanellus kitauei TaxID=669202 RepID=A0A0C2NFQ8_THEKT|nr:Vacuolar protein sorting/targeting protein 10 [Thelohanellus kitauei]
MRGVLPSLERYNEYFYYNGHHYFLAGNSESLCLCTFSRYRQVLKLTCNLQKYTKDNGKCSFVVNPHLPYVIYANIKKNKQKTRTYVSFDNGKRFIQIKLRSKRHIILKKNYGVELDLECSDLFINKHFPEKWVAMFRGKLFRKGLVSRHIFITFDGGMHWEMLKSRMEKIIVLNRGGLLFERGKKTHLLYYSFNQGAASYKIDIYTSYITSIRPLDFSYTRVVAAINYDKFFNIYTLLLFDFSNMISICDLMIDRTCTSDDFETVYVPRYHFNCFQGEEISYLKKKRSAFCFDNRTEVQPTIKPCPCSLEDFHCKKNYVFEDAFCKLDPDSNFTELNKTCRDGGIPLIRWNGYDVITHSFAQLDSQLCSPRPIIMDRNSKYADYCISTSNMNVY